MQIVLDRTGGIPLWRQIFAEIRRNIVNGMLGAEYRLPSSRELSEELGVSRNVVMESYDQLLAEGYVYSRSGAGTYVCAGLQAEYKVSAAADSRESAAKKKYRISFRTGIPDLSMVPVTKWLKAYKNVMHEAPDKVFDYGQPEGTLELRQALAEYLGRVRGTAAGPENIIITNGAAQAFNLLAAATAPEDYLLCENPLSCGLLFTLEKSGRKIKTVPVDEQGIKTDMLPSQAPRLIFTTPSHQFPTGSVLPAARRNELIKYAERHDAYIVEDDYDSEFRYSGNPIFSMQAMHPQRVIYVGTFAKTLLPAVRLGFMLVPDALRHQLLAAKYASDISSALPEQLTLAELIRSGAYAAHIGKMRKLYREKRNLLVAALEEHFPGSVQIAGDSAGLHLMCSFQGTSIDDNMLERIENAGIQVETVSRHAIGAEQKGKYANALLFGYGNTPREDIGKGIEVVAKILKNR